MGVDEIFERARGLFDEDTQPKGEAGPAAGVPAYFSESRESAEPNATEQSRLFDLLGRVNYAVLRGAPVYLQFGGRVYKILYGLYWQSVLTGARHWGFRCEEVGHGAWADGHSITSRVDLPLHYTKIGWVIEVESAQCLLYGDLLSANGDLLADALI